VDLRLGLDEAAAAASPAWELTELAGLEEGAFGVRMRSRFTDPDDLAARVADLQSALGPEDGRLVERLDLDVTEEGAATFVAEAGVVPPTVVGAEGDGVEFDGDDLAALLAEDGDRLVTAELRVTFPGPVVEHDGDEAAGATVAWRLPVGETRTLTARSDPPADRSGVLALAVAAVAAAGAAVLTLGFRAVGRRRFRRPG
jgi:hypothetical protein